MTGTDLHEDFERLMADEPPHRPLPVLVRAGERQLRSRRLSLGASALALAAVGVAAAVSLPVGDEGRTRDDPGFADTSSAGDGPGPTVPPRPGPVASPPDGHPLSPDPQPGYMHGTSTPCGVGPTCDRYEFKSMAASKPVVAAVEFRLTDGTTKRVETDDGTYAVTITGTLPPGDHWEEQGLVDAAGQPVDLLAAVTLFAADGSVLASATPTDSDALDPYLAIIQ